MKRFIISTVSITIIVIAIIAVPIVYRKIRYPMFSYAIPAEEHILFIGSSHIRMGIDDSQMESAKNMGGIAEPYMYTYLKLKYLLRDNAQIDTIFLEFSPVDICQNCDGLYFWEKQSIKLIPLYYPLFTKEEWMLFLNVKPTILKQIVQEADKFIYFDKESYMDTLGGYLPYYEVLDPKIHRTRQPDREINNSINISYLIKIIELCAEKEVKLYFLCCPMYKAEQEYNLDYFYNVYYQFFNNIELADYMCYYDNAPEMMRDATHMNYYGSQIFTKMIKEQFKIK